MESVTSLRPCHQAVRFFQPEGLRRLVICCDFIALGEVTNDRSIGTLEDRRRVMRIETQAELPISSKSTANTESCASGSLLFRSSVTLW